MADLERLDSFFDGTEPGDIPLAVLRERGIEMSDDATLDDEEVHPLFSFLHPTMVAVASAGATTRRLVIIGRRMRGLPERRMRSG